MPLPLTLAFLGMGAARRFHAASVAERPGMLRRAFYARVATYAAVGAAVAAANAAPVAVLEADDGTESVFP